MRRFLVIFISILIPATALTYVVPNSEAAPSGIDHALGMRVIENAYPSARRTAEWEGLLGKDVKWITFMTDIRSPQAMKASVWGQFKKSDAIMVQRNDIRPIVSIAVAFGSGKSKDAAGKAAARERLLETASGAHDQYYREAAEMIKAAGHGDAVIRLGHEFDGDFYPWSAVGNPEAYIKAYRHVHDVFASVSSDFEYEWTGHRAGWKSHAMQAYPGNAYVDVIGLDVYYHPTPADSSPTETYWNNQYLSVLKSHRDFAISKGKPVSFSEWGSSANEVQFIQRMYDWFASLPKTGGGSLESHVYFNMAPSNKSLDASLDKHPKSKARYLELFGSSGGSTTPNNPAAPTAVPVPREPEPETPNVAPPSAPTNQLMLVNLDRLAEKTDYFPTNDEFAKSSIVNQPSTYRGSNDYYNGTWYARVEIDKPSNKEIRGQLCMWQGPTGNLFQRETCSDQTNAVFVDDGVYWLELDSPASWWVKGGAGLDWNKKASRIRFMLKDPETRKLMYTSKCGSACYRGGDIDKHMPIDMDFELIMVPKGGTLTPPSGWASGCPSGWSSSCKGGENGNQSGSGTPNTTPATPPTTPTEPTPVPETPTTPEPETPATGEVVLRVTDANDIASKGGYVVLGQTDFMYVSSSCKAQLIKADISKGKTTFKALDSSYKRIASHSYSCDQLEALIDEGERTPTGNPSVPTPETPTTTPETPTTTPETPTTTPETPTTTPETPTTPQEQSAIIYVTADNDRADKGGYVALSSSHWMYVSPGCKAELIEAGVPKKQVSWKWLVGTHVRVPSNSYSCDQIAAGGLVVERLRQEAIPTDVGIRDLVVFGRRLFEIGW